MNKQKQIMELIMYAFLLIIGIVMMVKGFNANDISLYKTNPSSTSESLPLEGD